MREGRAAAQLRHPNIVSVFDAGELNGQHYLAIEFVSGSPLSELGSNRSFSQQQAAKMIADLARALHYAHSHKIIHRDIKPQNIVLNDKGLPQILDFGLAKSLADEAGLTIDGTVMGTPAYMSPEQARGDLKNVGPASDQYSLGATLYWLLTGQALFSGPPAAVIAQVISVEPEPPQKFTTTLDDRLAAICQKSISKLPSDRYESCLELARDLDRYLNDEIVLARPINAFGRLYRWAGKNRLDAALIAIACSVLAIAGLSSTFGYLRSSKLLAEANVLEGSVKKALSEIEVTKNELQTQAEALNQAKLRSVEAKQQLEVAQRAAEASQEELKSVIAENEKLQGESQKQLAIVTSNESKSNQLSKLAQEVKTETDRVVNRPLESMSSTDRVPIKNRIYKEAFDAIERKDFQAAQKILDQIPPQFRDTRWILQSKVIANQGVIKVVKKPFSEIFSNPELFQNKPAFVWQRIDSSNSAVQVEHRAYVGQGRTVRKTVFVDLNSASRLATSNPWTTEGYDRNEGQEPRVFANKPTVAILDSKRDRLMTFQSKTKDVAHRLSTEIRYSTERLRASYCEVFQTTNSGSNLYAGINARVVWASINASGDIVTLAQRKFESDSSMGMYSLVGNKQIGGTLQFITLNPEPVVSWSISDELIFDALLLPEFRGANLSNIEHRSGTKFFRSSNQEAYLPFEYYDSRLRQNIFGIYSIRDMKLARLVAVNRKDEKERDFTASRIIPEAKRWSEYEESKLLQLTDDELSNVELPPLKGWNYSLNLGESWGDMILRDGIVCVGETPVYRIPDLESKVPKVDVWSTLGDALAFVVDRDLWIINLNGEQISPKD